VRVPGSGTYYRYWKRGRVIVSGGGGVSLERYNRQHAISLILSRIFHWCRSIEILNNNFNVSHIIATFTEISRPRE
jgi:hypothetical protein